MIRTAGDSFDPSERPAYFLAAPPDHIRDAVPPQVHKTILLALNDLNSAVYLDMLDEILKRGNKVLLDSGVFWLTQRHMRKHGITMEQALAIPPEKIDGFGDLWKRYLNVMGRFGSRSWGYIEMDQGGREAKIKLRAKLEAEGLRPIPVYHPLNDGWDYFDYLAQRYDRLCVGNLVQAEAAVRLRLLATIWERHLKYPKLWVHILGLTPNEVTEAYPVDSTDSSAYSVTLRWAGAPDEAACGRTLGNTYLNYQYKLAGAKSQYDAAETLAAFIHSAKHRNWRHHMEAMMKVSNVTQLFPKELSNGLYHRKEV